VKQSTKDSKNAKEHFLCLCLVPATTAMIIVTACVGVGVGVGCGSAVGRGEGGHVDVHISAPARCDWLHYAVRIAELKYERERVGVCVGLRWYRVCGL
jgi:hypothetical protein